MPLATEADVARMKAAIAEARRQYAAAKPKVLENTAGLWNAAEKGSIRKAFLDVGVLLEKWAGPLYARAVLGKKETGADYSAAEWLEFGEKDIASAVKAIGGEAYDRSLFAAVKYAAAETAAQVNPLNWPPGVKLAVAAGVAVILVVAVAVVARRGGVA